MGKTKAEKEKVIKDLIDKFNQVKSLVLVSYQGLSCSEMQSLKSQIKSKDNGFQVVKNTLMKIALQKSDLKDVKLPEIKKPLALGFGYKDEVSCAKILYDFSKEHKALEIVGGVLGKKFLEKDEVITLAKLPSKNDLLVKMISTIKGPISGLVYAFSFPITGFVNILRRRAQENN